MKAFYFAAFFVLTLGLNSCQSQTQLSDPTETNNQGMGMMNVDTGETLSDSDKEALLFSLEEEKMAHEVYVFLYDKWGSIQFGNILNAEERHMTAVENVLKAYEIPYDILPEGKFRNGEIQKLYDEFIARGSLSEKDALFVGAGIEDVDIFDLRRLMAETENSALKALFTRLKCGSENHLRAFNRALNLLGETYQSQYISPNEMQEILSAQNQPCGKGQNGKGMRGRKQQNRTGY